MAPLRQAQALRRVAVAEHSQALESRPAIQILTYLHIWTAARARTSLPTEAKASALPDILSPENCAQMAQSRAWKGFTLRPPGGP
jgi:hypothetical protein